MLTMLCKSTLLGMRLATVCVMCYVVRDWLWITWEDSCCACEFVEGLVSLTCCSVINTLC
jgi:hypothetical protein